MLGVIVGLVTREAVFVAGRRRREQQVIARFDVTGGADGNLMRANEGKTIRNA